MSVGKVVKVSKLLIPTPGLISIIISAAYKFQVVANKENSVMNFSGKS